VLDSAVPQRIKNPAKIMKYHIKTLTMALVALASVQLARADIASVTNDPSMTSWANVGGNAPFYATTNSFNGQTAQGFPAPNAGSSYSLLSEYFTITNNGAGGMSAAAASSNWVLTAISVVAGGGSGPVQVHLFDITTNLTST
jgi:membrane-associated PAP2 superfamily phosphatase